jgi:hypothetical protein
MSRDVARVVARSLEEELHNLRTIKSGDDLQKRELQDQLEAEQYFSTIYASDQAARGGTQKAQAIWRIKGQTIKYCSIYYVASSILSKNGITFSSNSLWHSIYTIKKLKEKSYLGKQ